MSIMPFRRGLVIPVIFAAVLCIGFAACNWPEQDNQIEITVMNTDEWNEAMQRIHNTGSIGQKYIITIEDDIEVLGGSNAPTFGYISGLSVTLRGSGKLYLTSQGNMIRLAIYQTLIIDSPELILQGLTNGVDNANTDNNTAVVYLAASARLIMRYGTICGNTNSTTNSSGGGVYIDGGSFIMTGGAVSGNSAANGGGVYIYNSGGFTMTGGTISDNTCSKDGGGVFVWQFGNFIMTGGAVSGNSAANGGGVYIYNDGNFSKSGGIIYGKGADPDDNTANTGDTYGHAVYYYSLYPSYYENFYYRDETLHAVSNLSTAAQLPANSGQTFNGWTKRNSP